MKTTIELLRDAARTTPRSQLDAAAIEIANRRGAPVDACKRFVALESTLERRSEADGPLPTAEQLATLGALTREIATGIGRHRFEDFSKNHPLPSCRNRHTWETLPEEARQGWIAEGQTG